MNKRVIEIGGDFTLPGYSMISASGIAEAGEYEMVIGKSGRRWTLGGSTSGPLEEIK